MSESPVNPFESPKHGPKSSEGPDYAIEPPRPKSPMVLGLLSVIFSAVGILGTFFTMTILLAPEALPSGEEAWDNPLGYSHAYRVFNVAMGFILGGALLAAGVGLIRYRRWGRKLILIYSWTTILVLIGHAAYTMTILGRAGVNSQAVVAGGLIGGMFFPVICLAFMSRRRVIDSLK